MREDQSVPQTETLVTEDPLQVPGSPGTFLQRPQGGDQLVRLGAEGGQHLLQLLLEIFLVIKYFHS